MIGILGKKLGMTQIFEEDGRLIPVTVIEAGPCPILQVKDEKKEGYRAIQMGFGVKKEARTTKPLLGHFKKAKSQPVQFVKEVRLDAEQKYEVGQMVEVDIFKCGNCVDVTGISIGKGFQGGVKRWHWKGGPKTHGSMQHREPGSIGASSDPSRVFKGQHLPGRMGGKKVTIQNLRVVKVDKENGLLVVQGHVPGPDGNLLMIKLSKKKPFIEEKKPKAEAAPAKDEKGKKEAKKEPKKEPKKEEKKEAKK